ncbi:ETNK [Lepeophtheirus salmonis]|uniref:ethanolamine kinase n=2 Tax=Lepeophtheirus salmonis TaxID=72036 RepID=A0A7R8H9U5_LEPSM|nr:ETNK [Lepeophtheirus salmonis]CAF2960934.1 ETNK [Lepeophtheirus salmonis]
MPMLNFDDVYVDSDDYLLAEKTVLELLTRLRPQWHKRDILLIRTGHYGEVAHFQGYTDDSDDAILIKVFKSDLSKRVELNNVELFFYHGLCTKVFATFENGFCMKSLPGLSLNYKFGVDIDIYPLVAKKVGEMHRMMEYLSLSKRPTRKKDDIFVVLSAAISSIPETLTHPEDNLRRHRALPSIKVLRKEILELEMRLSGTSREVYCHGNLRPENIYVNFEESEVYFAELEFAGKNYRGLEVAQHFLSLIGNDLKLVGRDEYVPARDFQFRWCSHYLSGYMGVPIEKVSSLDMEELMREVQEFSLLFCLQEVIWSLTQHQSLKRNHFDTLQYGIQRYQQYIRNKYNIASLII